MNIESMSEPAADSTADGPMRPTDHGRLPRRSREDRYLGGVAGGLASRFDIDPFIIRAALLGATLFTSYAADWLPVVPAAYTLLWLTMPAATGRSALRKIHDPSGRRETVAALATFSVIALMLTRPIFGFALALAALAWVLLSDETPTSTPGPDVEIDGDSSELSELSKLQTRASWGRRRRSERGEQLVADFARANRRPRRKPALWPLTLSLLAIVAVGGFMADALVGGGIDPAIMVDLGLIAVGGVIVLSAWRGRALWTAVIALALLPMWIGFSVADIGRFPGNGSATYTPTALPPSGTLSYENGYGSMTIDLRQLPLEAGDELTVDVKTTAGTVTVLTQPTTDTVLHAKVGLGTTTVQGYGLGFYEYDREPHMDRFMVRRYDAHGSGCIQEYWATWSLLVENHERAGVELSEFDTTEPDDDEAILAAITAAGFAAPYPIDGAGLPYEFDEYESYAYEGAGARGYRIFDDYGNEYYVSGEQAIPIEQQLGLDVPTAPLVNESEPNRQSRTWSYSADGDGLPCVDVPPPEDPAVIEINATIGIGTLEVNRDEY